MFKKSLLALLTIPALLMGKILEIDSFEQIKKYVNSDTLIVTDLDNTLIESAQHLGSVQWGEHICSKLKEKGMTKEEAHDFVDQQWVKIQALNFVRTVDKESPKIINRWQDQGLFVVGMTARGIHETAYTHWQLNSVGIDLSRWLITDIRMKFQLTAPAVYDHGIIFCGSYNTKGEVMKAFLDTLEVIPKRVVFIDDKWHNVHHIEDALKPYGVEYIGIRFSKADERIKSYDPVIADMQWQLFPELITDEEARHLLHQSL